MIRITHIVLAVFLLAGCAGTDSMRSLQQTSLDRTTNSKIDRHVQFLGESEQRTLDSNVYLFIHSASIIFALSDDMHPTVEEIVLDDGDIGNKIVWKNAHGPAEGEGMRGGVACPISEDGYFLTAYHVLEDRITWLWTEQVVGDTEGGSDPTTVHLFGKLRIVYADKKQDFAIVKADYKVRHYLEIRESPLQKGEEVFGGGPWHNTGAGVIQSESRIDSYDLEEIDQYRRIYTSVPLAKGDSGSPLVDKKGNLIGVNTAGSHLKPWIFSMATMPDKASIMGIIEKDRISNQSAHTTPASAPR
ncbi:serine protease [Pelagicoccus sp. SDUM812003]|uniref:S1 family peptidase n=1 Tax=Pelagicoccus sp. SDUM812003 TaxID=3041267 RepID=UPI00280D5E46|nr:serine protease [Pelagicoccus sp. SDUM812003]MDQ8205792.1 serine protease [Pelagicoccus sp. SDUM812003]